MDEVVTGAPAEAPVTAPVVDAPAPAPAATPAAPASTVSVEPKSRHDTIREAMKAAKDGTLRGQHAQRQPREAGKFAGPPASATPAPVPLEAAPKPRPALLKSLKRELEPHWNTAPQELVEAFAEREAAFEKGAAQWQTKAQSADAVLEQFKPYEWMLRAEGATPQTAIAPLLQTAAILRTGTPQQKAQSVAQVMQQFGIPLEHIQSVMGGNQPTGQSVLDPHYNQLAQEVQSLKQNWTQTIQQQEQAQTQRAMTVIQQFAADPQNVHFEALQPKMLALLQTPDLLGTNVQFMSEMEKLKLAYSAALKLDPDLSQQVLAQQQADAQRQSRERAQQAANVAKAAAVQVTGAPGAPIAPSVNPNDRRSVIANALRSAQA